MVEPSSKNAAAALASIDLGADLTGNNPSPQAGYPIVTFSWVVLYKGGIGTDLPVRDKHSSFVLSNRTQASAPALGYVSPPAPTQSWRA
jgi:phosphate transport system substrate-binding protein